MAKKKECESGTRRGTEFWFTSAVLVNQLVFLIINAREGTDTSTLSLSVLGTCAVVCSYILGRSWVKVSENKTSSE
tara:strand:- start:2541 stop:2768 length:228 start_codon:yes stop_codon:yes gene_type:complete